MDQSPEDRGLRPDLSRLPKEIRNLIRHGSRDGHAECSDALVGVCIEMFRAGYGAAEIWMIMTDPTCDISKLFFSIDATQAEDWLERIIREANV